MKDQESAVKSWETGRKNLIEEQRFKRENERTHRAALYVERCFLEFGWTNTHRSLPGLLKDTALLRVCSSFVLVVKADNS